VLAVQLQIILFYFKLSKTCLLFNFKSSKTLN